MNDKLARMRDRLNVVSPSFCLAKWQQVTIHLQDGRTHSCHHPGTHLVSLEELKQNVSALHNTSFKKGLRKQMLEGTRPAECDYCWSVEDVGAPSDRYVKSADPWAEPHFDAVKSAPWDQDVVPSYVEVSFSSTCNFKCSYCGPRNSTKWQEEIRRHGGYPTTSNFNAQTAAQLDGLEREENPFLEAFWRWWPELSPKLSVFRITGGEPLLGKDTLRVLEWFIEHPRPDLQLSVNSNLGIPAAIYERFLELVAKLVTTKSVGKFELYTSCEAFGARAEYIRNGLDYAAWIGNVRRYFEVVPGSDLVIMSAFNALSLTSFGRFYDDVLAVRRELADKPGVGRVIVDIPYLRNPQHQSMMILPEPYTAIMDELVTHIDSATLASEMEKTQIKRIRAVLDNPWAAAQVARHRGDFYRFFHEHDRRRGTSFVTTFPEMVPFWRECKTEAGA